MARLQKALALRDLPPAVKAGQIVEGDAATIKALADDGAVDPHKDAVAYAASQGAAVVAIPPTS